MVDLSTKYLGLELRNPIVVGSSGLTDSVQRILDLEKNGAGAVVIKSLFEEEIIHEMEESQRQMMSGGHIYPEIFDMFDMTDIEDTVTKYLNTITEAKKVCKIPIIASVNCVSSEEWTVFGKRIQEAGADALELNLFVLPSDFSRTGEENEAVYFDVIKKIKQEITIPISLKISYFFSNLGSTIQKLSKTGISGLTLFNRFFSPDFDIDSLKVFPASIYSTPAELSTSLRWIAIMAERVDCDLAASTGIHDGKAVIKQILAGANAVHIASCLYKFGPEYIQNILKDMQDWMDDNGYKSLKEFKGKMSQAKSSNPAAFERGQFMKHFSGK